MAEPRPSGTPEPTEIAGRYQIIKKLGAGAFGTVFKAKDKILGRMVAIKTIRMDTLVAAGASVEEMLKRFTREAQVAAQLKHPNIVTVYDINTADDQAYLAMEFIDGVGLDHVIVSDGQMSVERAASIGAQVADGLDFAHKAGVVHRDIKPANIMIEPGDRAKVTDFGIAKATDSGDHLTMTGSLLGTPSYMSPEQARGSELDGRSDLFAVGCVLYEMVAGKKAFRGDSITGLIFKIITEDPPPLRELRPDVPEEYLRIVNKALAKTVATRYQNGGELKADLDALVRPGSTPTLRTNEAPTAPGVLPPAAPAYMPTLSGASTAVGWGAAQVGQATAAAAPGVAPTQIAAPVPPPAAGRPALAAPRAARVPAPPRKGGGAGVLVALLLFGVLFLGVAGVGGWYFFLRTPQIQTSDLPSGTNPTPGPEISRAPTSTTTDTPNTGTTGGPTTSLPPDTGTTSNTGHEATPSTGTYTSTPPAATTNPIATNPQVTVPTNPRTPRTPPPSETADMGHGADTSFLDQEPAEADPEIGARTAGAYRSSQGSNSGGYPSSGRRFTPRARSPQARSPLERAAIATLRHLANAQLAYEKKSGRYGSFADLKQAQRLFLDVPVQARDFVRKSYRFSMELSDDGFKVTAQPMAVGLRQFYVDENEIINEGGGDE